MAGRNSVRAFAAAEIIKITSSQIKRWLVRGYPRVFVENTDVFTEWMTMLYTLLSRWDTDTKQQSRRDTILRIAAREATEKKAAASRIKEWIEYLEEVAIAEGRKERGPRLLAEKLGVTVGQVRGWQRRREITGKGLRLFLRFEEREKHGQAAAERDKRDMRQLMSLGRKKKTKRVEKERRTRGGGAKRVMGEVEEPRTPSVKTTDGYFGGEETSGWRWSMKVAEYLSWTVVEQMVDFARRVRPMREGNEWRITALCSELILDQPNGKQNNPKYGTATREDIADEHERGGSFVVSEPYSGDAWHTRQKAIDGFVKRMRDGIKSGNLIFVHGVVVWNYRRRSEAEKRSRVEARELAGQIQKRRSERLEIVKRQKKLKETRPARRQAFLEGLTPPRSAKKRRGRKK